MRRRGDVVVDDFVSLVRSFGCSDPSGVPRGEGGFARGSGLDDAHESIGFVGGGGVGGGARGGERLLSRLRLARESRDDAPRVALGRFRREDPRVYRRVASRRHRGREHRVQSRARRLRRRSRARRLRRRAKRRELRGEGRLATSRRRQRVARRREVRHRPGGRRVGGRRVFVERDRSRRSRRLRKRARRRVRPRIRRRARRRVRPRIRRRARRRVRLRIRRRARRRVRLRIRRRARRRVRQSASRLGEVRACPRERRLEFFRASRGVVARAFGVGEPRLRRVARGVGDGEFFRRSFRDASRLLRGGNRGVASRLRRLEVRRGGRHRGGHRVEFHARVVEKDARRFRLRLCRLPPRLETPRVAARALDDGDAFE